MKLKELVHIRTGDKGNICNIAVIPYDESNYERLKEILTTEKVQDFYSDIVKERVVRYEVDSICAFNFVLYGALNGGVTRSLAVDKHGKALGMALLEMEVTL